MEASISRSKDGYYSLNMKELTTYELIAVVEALKVQSKSSEALRDLFNRFVVNLSDKHDIKEYLQQRLDEAV